MSRYIEVNDVANAIYHHFPSIRTMADARGIIEEAPSIDIPQWTPCSERLPEISGMYLVWMKWSYEEYPSWAVINYDADCEAFGAWHEYYHPDTLGFLDSEFVEIKDVYAWMPLPKPYRERKESE